MRMCTMAMWLITKLFRRRWHSRSNGRSMVGVAATPTMLQSLSVSAFQPCDGRRVGVYSRGAFFSWRRASLNWSGHEVLLAPQRIPCKRPMTSSILWPFTSWLMPCRLPLQPPMKNTCCITSCSSAVTSMAREHTPEGVYRICFVFILLS